MGGYLLMVTKQREGDFTLEVHNLFRYTGLSAMASSFADVLDAAVMELGLSVHEVGKVQISASPGERLDPDDGCHGKFFTGYLKIESDHEGVGRTYTNSRCWGI
ncbi:MAG: hypothetical protein COB05_00940 [Marinobacter sp.]|nr:MAG: hypothetical protein COB05_00940 [Marinobacter sp.]